MKCPKCGHNADMHWSSNCPPIKDFNGQEEYHTTACRDCLPRAMYPLTPEDGVRKGLVIDGGMCTWTKEFIERVRFD